MRGGVVYEGVEKPKNTARKVTRITCCCRSCGATFDAARRDARYCGPRCRAAARAERRAARVECAGCGAPFVPSRPTQAYCDPQCRVRAERRRRYARRRRAEGGAVRPRGARRGPRPGPAAVCPVCGGSFRPARSTQVYCGPECRRRAARAARSRAALLLPAAGACRVIARMHVPDTAGRCCECARPWPCETYRIAAKMAS